MDSSIFVRSLLSETVILKPANIGKNFKEILLSTLKDKIEGIVTKHGYIRKNSVEVYKYSPGTVELSRLNGYLLYDVFFYCDLCMPMIGANIVCQVSNANVFGILANAGFVDNDEYVNVLEIIIPKNVASIPSEIDLDSININDKITIQVTEKQLKLTSETISVIGRVVENAQKNKTIDIEEELNVEPEEEDYVEGGDVQEDESDADEEKVDEDDEDEEEVDEVVGGGDGGEFFDDEEDQFFESDAGSIDEDDMDRVGDVSDNDES